MYGTRSAVKPKKKNRENASEIPSSPRKRSDRGDFAATGRIARDLGAIVYGEKYEIPKERVAIQVDPKIYDAYVGKYELRPDFILTITLDGNRLLTQLTGQPMTEIFPESESKFFLKVVDAQLTFVKAEDGKVSHVILHQGGRDQKATRLP